jgi:hypothetical protein
VKTAAEFELKPTIHLADGRTINNVADAIALVREHEKRLGVDDRDEMLHALERATSNDERAGGVERFRLWLESWGLTLPITTRPWQHAGPEIAPVAVWSGSRFSPGGGRAAS